MELGAAMKYSPGRYLYGWAAIDSGICALAWHDFTAFGAVPHRRILIYIAATIEILGGVAVQWLRTVRTGAVALGTIYFLFALLGVPLIIEHPLVYNGFGNFFEQLSLASGAVILYACPVASARTARLAQIGYYSFGICVVSFALEQLFYLKETASLVPKWIPPGQIFWAIATTAASCRDRSTHGIHGAARGAINHGDDRGFRVANMAADALPIPIVFSTGPKVRRLLPSPRRHGLSQTFSTTVAQHDRYCSNKKSVILTLTLSATKRKGKNAKP
jgi:hypothetical protein